MKEHSKHSADLAEVQRIILTDEVFEARFRDVALNHPEKLAHIIAPILGPAIKRSIADLMERMMESFERARKRSFTVEGLQWRWEAMRTGRPYAEVVLLHSLESDLEDIFLVQKETGILLLHQSAKEAEGQSDQVAGILTAIQDLFSGAFEGPVDERALRSIHLGDLTIVIEAGERTFIAAAIRGEPSPEFRDLLRQKVRAFERNFTQEISRFRGDTQSFKSAEPLFQDLFPKSEVLERKGGSWEDLRFILLFIGAFLIIIFYLRFEGVG